MKTPEDIFQTVKKFSLMGMILILPGCQAVLPTLERSIFDLLSLLRTVDRQLNPPSSESRYPLGFQVNNLQGTGLVVSNAGENITVTGNGFYSFSQTFLAGQEYNVQIVTQPTLPDQICTVLGGQGLFVQGPVHSVQIECSPGQSPIVGSVDNLQGAGLELTFVGSANGGVTYTIPINGTSFSFPSQPPDSTYSLGITGQPINPQQTCVITGPSPMGIMPPAGLQISIQCQTTPYPLSITVSGLVGVLPAGSELVVNVDAQPSPQSLAFSTNGTLTFPMGIPNGSSYTVSIQNPGGVAGSSLCTVSSPTGVVGLAGTTVSISCVNSFTIQGSVTVPGGSPSSVLGSTGPLLRITNTGGSFFETREVVVPPGATSFALPLSYPENAQYSISIVSQPSGPSQTCILTGSTSGNLTASVNDLVLNCSLPEPVFGMSAGTHYNSIAVPMTPGYTVSGANIRYTLGDGTQANPDCSVTGVDYSGPIAMSDNANSVIKAMYCGAGWVPSSVVPSGTFAFYVSNPTASVASGSTMIQGAGSSFSTATAGAWICQTSAAVPSAPSDPVCGATAGSCNVGIATASYTHPGIEDRTVKNIGCLAGFYSSAVQTTSYPVARYNLGGNLSGYSPSTGSLGLANGAVNVSVSANGGFSFPGQIASGASYNVVVATQPTEPWQTCVVSNASGTVTTADVSNVSVTCTVNTYSMSGEVTSATALGAGLQISNGVETISVTGGGTNTPISFPTVIASGTSYNLSIVSQPADQTCTILSTVSGTITNANITNVSLSCANTLYPVTVSVVGIPGSLDPGNPLLVSLNGSDSLSYLTSGNQNFSTQLANGAAYNVTILNAGGIIATGACVVVNPSGSMTSGGVTVTVICSDGFLVQGTIASPGGSLSSILGSGMVLRLANTGGVTFATQDLALSAGQTSFIFPNSLPSSAGYSVSILTSPSSPFQICNLTGSTTGSTSGNISDLVVNCALPDPVVATGAGSFTNDVNVTVNPGYAVTDGVIYYTLGDGTHAAPTCSGADPLYAGSILISSNSANAVKAIYCRTGWTGSQIVSSGSYILNVADPIPDTASGSSLDSAGTVSFMTATGSAWHCSTTANAPAIPADPVCGGASSTCSVGTLGSFVHPGLANQEVKYRACKVGYNSSAIASASYPVNTYPLSGNISGLYLPFTAGSFVLENSGFETLQPTVNGIYSFTVNLPSGTAYTVGVISQPTDPWQTCVLSNGTGTVSNAPITNLDVSCTRNTYFMSGGVLSDYPLQTGLQISNGTDTISVATGNTVTPLSFPTALPSGTNYTLSIVSSPTEQVCGITGATTGTVTNADIATVDILCSTNHYPVTVNVTGIPTPLTAGNELVLQLNGSDNILATTTGTVQFPMQLRAGEAYSVTIQNPGGVIPTGTCSIVGISSGSMVSPGVSVDVECTNGFSISGTVTVPDFVPSSILGTGTQVRIFDTTFGTPFSSVVLDLNPGDTSFSFNNIPGGANYTISVVTQPTSPVQTCQLTGPTAGTVSSPITGLVLACGLPPLNYTNGAGTYANDVSTEILPSHAVPGASIFYTLGDGTQVDPNCTGMGIGYGGAIFLNNNSNNTIKAIYCGTGWLGSPVANSGAHVFTVMNPAPSPSSGTGMDMGQEVFFNSTTSGFWLCKDSVSTPVCGGAASTCDVGTVGNPVHPGMANLVVNYIGCRVGYNPSAPLSATYPVNTYMVSGTVSGLQTPFAAGSFVLQLNGADDLSISTDGSFSFPTALPSGAGYSVTVFSHPLSPNQTCSVTNGSGTVTNSNITNVAVDCTTPSNFAMGGTVTSPVALGTGLVISNGVESVPITGGGTNTAFSFPLGVGATDPYNLTIVSEPSGQVCAFESDLQGTMLADTTDLKIHCVPGYRLAGSVIPHKPAPLAMHPYKLTAATIAGSVTDGGFINSTGTSARFSSPESIIFHSNQGLVVEWGNHTLRSINPATNSVSTLTGNGFPGNVPGTGTGFASLSYPIGAVTDGVYVYICEGAGRRVKRFNVSTNAIETFAGDDSVAIPTTDYVDSADPMTARFGQLTAIALDGEMLYLADWDNHTIRTMNIRTREVGSLVGLGAGWPVYSMVVVGNTLYVPRDNIILMFDKNTGISQGYIGNPGSTETSDGIGSSASFGSGLHGITTDGLSLYVVDNGNRRLRKVDLATMQVTTLAGENSAEVNGSGFNIQFALPKGILNIGSELVVIDWNALRVLGSQDLVFHYPFNGNTLSIGNDSEGLAENASTIYQPGRFGESNGGLLLAPNISFSRSIPSPGSNVSFSAWANWNGTILGGFQYLFFNGTPALGGYGVALDSEGYLNLVTSNGTPSFYPSYIRIQPGEWFHVTLVRESGSNVNSLYWNGKLVSRWFASAVTPSGGFWIGVESETFQGVIADLRLYNRVLSEGEIADIASQANPGLVGPSYSSTPKNLLAHYKLDGNPLTSGSVGFDLSMFNAPGLATGKDGSTNSAYRFYGGQRMTGQARGLPLGNAPRAICAWVSPAQYPNVGQFSTIVQYGDIDLGKGIAIRLGNDGIDKRIHFGTTVAGSNIAPISPIPLNSWSHVCGNYTGGPSPQLQIYVNGMRIFQGSSSLLVTDTGSLSVGATPTLSNPFMGKIDDVRIYGQSLSEYEIRQLATQNPVGLVARYDMLNGDGFDVSGMGNHASVSGTTTVPNRLGMAEAAVFFNGSNAFWEVQGSRVLPRGSKRRTLCAWVRTRSSSGSIAGYGSASANQYFGLELTNTQMVANVWDANVSANHFGIAFVWNHLCVIGQETITTLVLNGAVVGNMGQTPNTVEDTFFIGTNPAGIFHEGTIGEVVLYNRHLGLNEIRALSGYHPRQVSTWNVDPATSSLKLFLQAESLSNAFDGQPVTLWKDHSGNGYDFSSATANHPFYDSVGFNKKPGIYFPGSGHFSRGATPDLQITGTHTMLFSVSWEGPYPAGTLYQMDSSGYGLVLYGDPSGQFIVDYPYNATSWKAYSSDLTMPSILTSLYYPSGGSGFINGEDKTIFSYSSSLGAMGGNIMIGGGDGGDMINGVVSDVLFFQGDVTSTNNSRILHCYFSSRYGIPIPGTVGYYCD